MDHIFPADLKPENILLTADNHVKIIDFGTAKEIGTAKNGTDFFSLFLQVLRMTSVDSVTLFLLSKHSAHVLVLRHRGVSLA